MSYLDDVTRRQALRDYISALRQQIREAQEQLRAVEERMRAVRNASPIRHKNRALTVREDRAE